MEKQRRLRRANAQSVVKLTPMQREVLKDVVGFNQTTVSDYLSVVQDIAIKQQGAVCPLVRQSLKLHALDEEDHRITKPCAGWPCTKCDHLYPCKSGDYTGLFEMSPEQKAFLEARGYKVATTYETVTMQIPITKIDPI